MRKLDGLVEFGAVTYRDTTDEYRIWQGTSVDIVDILERHRAQPRSAPRSRCLTATAPLGPVVATGHSLRTDTLRTFERRYTTTAADLGPPPPGSKTDGRIYFTLDPDFELPRTVAAGMPGDRPRPG